MIVGLSAYAAPELAEAVACGDTIGPGGIVTLEADLVCESLPVALRVVGPVVLDLNGHTVTCVGDLDEDEGDLEEPIGILVQGNRALVKNGTVTGCETGVVVGYGRGASIKHVVKNVTARGNYDGFYSYGGATTFIGNEAADNSSYGFNSDSPDGDTFISNSAHGNRSGFWTWSSATLIGNVAMDNGEGFWAFFSTLSGNRAERNTYNGFSIGVSRAVGNTARANGGDGIWVWSGNSTVIDNRVVNNGRNGILVNRGEGLNRVARNRVSRHASPFFDLVDRNPGCQVFWGANTWERNVFSTRSQPCID